ncbi:MAG: DUF4062 domain-containing protein [Candidatus Kapaibacterium sp.]
MPQTNELRIFISSTFRDLGEEREHLIKKIFPEIRALCRERGVTFTDVDLRWGLTEEQATLGTVIRTCLEEVDLSSWVNALSPVRMMRGASSRFFLTSAGPYRRREKRENHSFTSSTTSTVN